jgi:hypothetical protein
LGFFFFVGLQIIQISTSSGKSHKDNSKNQVTSVPFNLVSFIFVKIEQQKWLDSPFMDPKPPQNIVQGDLFS